jgi:hypothetical protein
MDFSLVTPHSMVTDRRSGQQLEKRYSVLSYLSESASSPEERYRQLNLPELPGQLLRRHFHDLLKPLTVGLAAPLAGRFQIAQMPVVPVKSAPQAGPLNQFSKD